MKQQSQEVICKYCSKSFFTKRNAKYCSIACSNRDRLLGKGELQPKPCEVCGTIYKPQKRTTRFCSNQCSAHYKSQDPNFIDSLKTGCAKRSQKPEYLQKLSQRAQERWSNVEFKKKMRNIFDSDEWIEGSINYANKEYTMPSGKTVLVQGYEDRALDVLLEKYSESDILVDRRDIRERIGQITYELEGKTHQYIPDIYIISENLVIEVKSEWTYRINKDVNLLKRDAVLTKGISFEFMIL